jgi:hypothetical protein
MGSIIPTPKRQSEHWSNDHEVHVVHNVWRIVLGAISILPLVLLGYYWHTNGHTTDQKALLVYVIGRIFGWIISPLYNWCNPPHVTGSWVEIAYVVYFVLNVFLWEYGLGLFLWGYFTARDISEDPNSHYWLWILFGVMYIFDMTNFCCFVSFIGRMEKQRYEGQVDPVIPPVTVVTEIPPHLNSLRPSNPTWLPSATSHMGDPPRTDSGARSNQQSIQVVTPVQDSQVDAEPVLIIEKSAISKHSYYTVCGICTENFKEGDDVKELGCKHIFHPGCIESWLVNHDICPMCMGKI